MKKNKFTILCSTILASSFLLGACNNQPNTKIEASNTKITSEKTVKDEQKDNEDISAIDDEKEVTNNIEDKKVVKKEEIKNTTINTKNTANNIDNKSKNETAPPKATPKVSSSTTSSTPTVSNSKPAEKPSGNATSNVTPKPESKPKDTTPVNTVSIKPLPKNYSMSYNASFEDEIIRLTNELRKKHGLAPLRADSALRESARYKSNSMLQLNYFSHSNPNYNGADASYLILDVFKIKSMVVGENIGSNWSTEASDITAQFRFDGWLNSPPHKAAMLDSDFTRIGVGIVISKKSDGTIEMYGTQHFAK